MSREIFPVNGSDELYGEVFLRGGEPSVRFLVEQVQKGFDEFKVAKGKLKSYDLPKDEYNNSMKVIESLRGNNETTS